MDSLSPQQRHNNMAAIRGRATKPEMLVRRWLWSHGYRYRLNVKSVPGKADIVMRRYRTAIFVNGCFWHGHGAEVKNGDLMVGEESCFKMPKSNIGFWSRKIIRNKERDSRNYKVLHDNGWQVIVIWECQLKPARIDETMRGVEVLLNRNFLALFDKTNRV